MDGSKVIATIALLGMIFICLGGASLMLTAFNEPLGIAAAVSFVCMAFIMFALALLGILIGGWKS